MADVSFLKTFMASSVVNLLMYELVMKQTSHCSTLAVVIELLLGIFLPLLGYVIFSYVSETKPARSVCSLSSTWCTFSLCLNVNIFTTLLGGHKKGCLNVMYQKKKKTD